jgi:hypothetical protein
MQETSKNLFELKKRLKGITNQNEKEDVSEQINNVQKQLSNFMEAKEEASRMRISNFYLTGNGTVQPQSFYCTKDRNTSRKIQKLVIEDRQITDPEEIIITMQEWYEKTAGEESPQTMTLEEFLIRHNINLPQVTLAQKEELSEEFTLQEVIDAINEAHEASASGPSGQSITFFKLLLMEVPNLLVEALNQMVFHIE